ncbi:MAG TPA: transcriptional repressor LexA, partial [Jatrophihabitantaceae bacterium]|nr:transcriptional repressor LexA [Jatrophihabitantaceae bacterium]
MPRQPQPKSTPRKGASTRGPAAASGDTSAKTAKLAKVTALADRERAADGLTARQRVILDVIRDSVRRRGYPPSIREICEAAGLASTSSVAHQLSVLERKGYLRRDPNRPRAVDVRSSASKAKRSRQVAGADDTRAGAQAPVFVPVVGRIAAGGPILAEQLIEDVFPLPR